MGFWQWAQFVLSFTIVIGLAYFASRYMGQRVFSGRNKDIRIHSTTSLGGRRYLSLVQVHDQMFLLGVTDHQVTLIKELDADNFEPGSEQITHQGEKT